jgi:hypothetical protein
MRPSVFALLALCSSLASSVRAQTIDLGEIEIALPFREPPTYFMPVLAVPAPTPSDVPASASDELERWRGACRASPSIGDCDASAAALAAALEVSEPSLSRPALLLLGMLRYREAEQAFAACADAPGSSAPCPTTTDCTRAIETWSRIAGDDSVAAYARFEIGACLAGTRENDRAMAAFDAVLDADGLPDELVAVAAFYRGVGGPEGDAHSVARTFGRCAGIGIPHLSERCLEAAVDAFDRLGLVDEPIALLAPRLTSTDETTAFGAAEVIAHLLARVGAGAASHLPTDIDPAARAAILRRTAQTLERQGLFTWALEALEGANAILPHAVGTERIAALTAHRAATIDTPERWLQRAIAFCLGRAALPVGAFRVRWRFGRTGARAMRIVVERDEGSGLASVVACLRTDAPPTESWLRGAVTAHVVFTIP